MDSPKTFQSISPEIQLEAIKLLEKAADRVAASGVCRHWRQLTADTKAWQGQRTLVIGHQVPAQDACRLVTKFSPGLKSVSYRTQRDADYTWFLQALIDQRIGLRKLDLKPRFGHPTAAMAFKLMEYAASTGELESMVVHLNILGTPCNFDSICDSLKEFVLYSSRGITWPNFFKIMAAFPNLKLFYLNTRFVGPFPGMEKVKEESSKILSKVEGIKLDPSGMNDSDLAAVLSSLQELRVLILDGLLCQFPSTLYVVSRMDKLVFLSMMAAYLPSVFEPECQAGFFQWLKRLDLTSCSLDKGIVKSIARHCPNLSWLEVVGCDMSNEVVTEILDSCERLRILSLRGVAGLTGVPWMSRLPTTARDLQLLNITQPDDGSIPVDSVEKAARDRPGLFIAKGDTVYRGVRVAGGDPRIETFPATQDSQALLRRHPPSLRAIRENQVVPENIAEYVTRPRVAQSTVRVEFRDLSSHFILD